MDDERFEWDEENVEHNVEPEEAEEALSDRSRVRADAYHVPGERRRALTRRAEHINWIPVNSPDEIPNFANEAEEHEFWKTHELGPGMFENPGPPDEIDALVQALPQRPRSSATKRSTTKPRRSA